MEILKGNGKKGMKYNEWAANKSESSKKAQLRKDINQTIRIVSTYSEFLAFMEAKGYEIKNAEFGENRRKYITFRSPDIDRKSTRLNSSHLKLSRMPSSA